MAFNNLEFDAMVHPKTTAMQCTVTNYSKTLLFIFWIGILAFGACKKNDPSKDKDAESSRYGLLPTDPSVYLNIPVATLPPTGGSTLPGSFFLEVPEEAFDQGVQGSCSGCASAMAKSITDHTKLGV